MKTRQPSRKQERDESAEKGKRRKATATGRRLHKAKRRQKSQHNTIVRKKKKTPDEHVEPVVDLTGENEWVCRKSRKRS